MAERLALADAQFAELGDDRGALRVGGFPSALATLVPAAIASVVPQRVEAVEGTVEELAAWVADGSLHVAVLFQDAAAPGASTPGLRRHELARRAVRDQAVGPRAPPRASAHGPPDASSRTTRGSRPPRRGIVRNACVAAGFEPDIAFVARDVLAIRALVAGGPGGHADARGSSPITCTASAPSSCATSPRAAAVYALTPRTGTRAAAREFLDALRAVV